MAAQEQKNSSIQPQNEEVESNDLPVPAGASAAPQVATAGVDDLLAEIDGVLESNAEEFVRGFVQKGGQ